MKGRIGSLLAMSALFANDMMSYGVEKKVRVEHDTEGQIERRMIAYQEVLRDKGLKWFDVDGVKVLALNRKNAERKAKKLKPVNFSKL